MTAGRQYPQPPDDEAQLKEKLLNAWHVLFNAEQRGWHSTAEETRKRMDKMLEQLSEVLRRNAGKARADGSGGSG